MIFVQGFAKLFHIKSDHDMIYMISFLNKKKFNNTIHHIRVTNVIKFPKLFLLASCVYDATLCNRLFHNADGIIKNTSISVSHNAHIHVYTNHCEVGKKLDKNIKTMRV